MSSGDTSVVDTSLNGGFDLSFDLPILATGEYIGIGSNVAINACDLTGNTISIYKTAGGLDVKAACNNGVVVDEISQTWGIPTHVRMTFHDCFCTLQIDDQWFWTFGFAYIKYPPAPSSGSQTGNIQLSIFGTDQKIVSNIEITELYDWREAIWIDMETTSMNAMSSVIQERPVEIIGNYLGEIVFYYTPDPANMAPIEVGYVKEDDVDEEDNQGLASDAIVYYLWQCVTNNRKVAQDYGFITRVFRMPDLTTGAKKAAQVAIRKAYQSTREHTTTLRFYPQIEIGDLVRIKYGLPGLGQAELTYDVIVETLVPNVASTRSTLRITGRENL